MRKAWYTLFVSRDKQMTDTTTDMELIDTVVHGLVDDAENALDFVENVRMLLARVPADWEIARVRNALHELKDDIEAAIEAAADAKNEAGGW